MATKKASEKTKKEDTEQAEPAAEAEEPTGKRHVEDRLDDVAERFSSVMSEGVKRMEDAFDKGMKAVKANPNLSGGNLKGFFLSSTGGTVLIIFGVIWFLFVVGLFTHWVFPMLVIAIGAYLMYRYRAE